MPVNTPLATAILVEMEVIEPPMPSLTILPRSLQQLEKVVLSPGGRQRIARPEKISILPRHAPAVSTSPSAGTPGSSVTGSSSIGVATGSVQALGEHVGVPPLAGAVQA